MAGTLKVGIIGVGGIAGSHIPGWDASEHAKLVAGCDIDKTVLKRWGQKHEVSKLTTDSADLFNDPDIIDISTPNAHHAPLSHRCVEGRQTRHL